MYYVHTDHLVSNSTHSWLLSFLLVGLASQVLFVGLFVFTSSISVLVVGPKRTGIKLFLTSVRMLVSTYT